MAARTDSVLMPEAKRPRAMGATQLVHTASGPLGPFELHVPGRHNVLNATASVAIAHQLAVPVEKIAEELGRFRGVDRRFQHRGEAGGVTVRYNT